MTDFTELNLHKSLQKAITTQGYSTPSPIQAQAIPHLLEQRDLLGIAQTGTGKTAAFALPTLDHLVRAPLRRQPNSTRVLILAPTRELAGQIAESFRTYAQFTDCVTLSVFGGVKINRQIRDLNKGCHVLVATPGRLVDLVNQGAVSLSEVEVLILDEADQMLDMGFLHDLKKIMAQVPNERQTLLFSATMPTTIKDLANTYLDDPVHVSVTPESTTAERVDQSVLHVGNDAKLKLLAGLLQESQFERVLVFTRTKHGADKVVRKLLAKQINAQAIHGNKSQPQRMRALEAFREGKCKVLIATDIAARGIDIDGISHVINFEMPNLPEQYVHRIGRTARAGRGGRAISFVAPDELYYLREVEKSSKIAIEVSAPPAGYEDTVLPTPDPNLRVLKPKGPSRGGRGGSNNGGRQGGRKMSNKPQASGSNPKRRNRRRKPAKALTKA